VEVVGLEEFGELLEGGAGEAVVGVGAGDHPEVELGPLLELGLDVLEEAPVAAAMAAALETRARLRGGEMERAPGSFRRSKTTRSLSVDTSSTLAGCFPTANRRRGKK
jgi:hypothetical protein